MNRGRLIARVAASAGLDDTTGSEERTLMEEWANEGVVEVLLATKIRVEIGLMPLTIGEDEYRMDTDMLAVFNQVPYSDDYFNFDVVTLEDMNHLRATNSAASPPTRAIAIEGDLLIVWPTPTQAETIKFFFLQKPAPMTNDAHDPSTSTYGGIPDQHHRAIEAYMLWQAAIYDEKRAPRSPDEALKNFDRECALIRKRKRTMSGRGLAPAKVGYPGRRRTYGRRNDVYPER